MIPGCLAWAGIYTAVGAAATTLFRTFTWWFVGALLLALVVGVVLAIRRRRGRD
jgi:membrane protein DedA with SNARE-associated domain